MQRLFLSVLMALPLMQAADLETGLATVRQRLGGRWAERGKLLPMHRRAALVSRTLAETAAALEGVERPEARGQFTHFRERLLVASRALESGFASIDAKLEGLGLPEKTAAWQDFLRHYRARLAEVDAELASLAANGTNAPEWELRERLKTLRVKLGGIAGLPQESVQGMAAWGTPEIAPSTPLQAPQSKSYAAADDVPGPSDLASSKVVLLTQEIRARAAALGGRPTNLYNWVATHIEYVPYVGQMQNSLAVLMSGRGNAHDQATLLIALLRASGIPARYVCADVAMTVEEVRDWLGVKDEGLIVGLLSRGLAFKLFGPSTGDEYVALGHVWVEAYLDTGSSKGWYSMDPARKRRNYQPGIVLEHPPYDRMAYLRAFKPVLPSESYLDAQRAQLQKNYPGRGFNEVPYFGTLLAPPPAPAGTPYRVVKLQYRSSEVPEVQRHRINLSLSEYGRQTRFLSVDLSLPEIVLQSLSLTYNPATAADRQVVEAFGGLENAPAAVVNLVPEIRVAGAVVAAGKTPIAAGTAMDLTVTHTPVGQTTPPYVSNNLHHAGETAAVILGANQISEELLTARITTLLDRMPIASVEEATRRLLDLAALRYLQRLGWETQRLSDFLQVRFIQASGVENAICFASLEPQYLFDRPFVVTPGRLRIHADPARLPLVDLNRSDQSGPVLKIAWQLHNDAASALEHEIWEEVILVPAASTIKVLQTAIKNNIPIYIVDRKNAATELPKIQGTASTKATMQERINKGATLTVPGRPVTIGSWQGQGWIEEYDDGWSYAYIIDVNSPAGGLAPGGDSGGTPPQPRPPASEPGPIGPPRPTGGTPCSDPVNVSNGNVFEQAVDYLLRGPGAGIVFQRTYNSLALADGPLGPGWRHNFQMSLKVAGTAVTVVDESGGVLNFRLESGAYISPPGYNLTLTQDADGYLLKRRTGMQFRFDAQGVLQSITDRNQNTLQLSYDAERLSRISDRAGRGMTLSYDGKGRLVALEDFLGRRVGYEYDADGRLVAVADLAGNRTLYAYYTDRIFKHLLQSITTPQGRVTQFEYYGNGKASRVTDPGGQSMRFLYLPLRNETHVIDEQGLLWSYQYNGLGNVLRVVAPDGRAIDSVYNADAKLEARTDAAGYTTRFTYDAAGNMTSVTDPLNRTVQFVYEPALNQVTAILDARGNLTLFEYDARGNAIRIIRPLGVETQLAWDEAGNLTSVTDAEGNATRILYDSFGNPVEVRDTLGNVTKYEYDSLGRPTRIEDPLGGETRREYDAMDRLVKLIDPLARTAQWAYDRDGRLGQSIDFGNRTTKFYYDPLNHLIQVADALEQRARYVYTTSDCDCSAATSMSLFQDAAGHARTQTYDAHARMTSTTDALGNRTQYTYDARGYLTRKIDANGNTTTFEYDGAGQLVRKAFSDGTEVRFAFDADGNVVSAENAHIGLNFTFDELGRLTSETESRFGKTVRYSYDRQGRRTEMVDSEGGVSRYTYDANGRLMAVTSSSGASVQFGYDALGRTTAAGSSTLKYDTAARVLEVTHPFAAFAYDYDPSGNRTVIADPGGRHAYQYDELNRLTGAQHEARPAEVYTYDAAGNRTSSASDPAYAYDVAGRLKAAEGATFTYDKNGNLTSRTAANGKTTYTWDIENRLVGVDLPDGGTVRYKYDPFGRRIEKNVNGAVTTYFYDRNAILMEMDGAGQALARYTQGPGVDWPLLMERTGQTFYYHVDALGSVVALTDSSGNVVRSYAYDSWGRPLGEEAGGPANPFLFAGREYDRETGLYYLRARYYDPAVGRFISSDPLDIAGLLLTGQEPASALALLPVPAAALKGGAGAALLRAPQRLNPYSYALNNPAALRDPSGLEPCEPNKPTDWEKFIAGLEAWRDQFNKDFEFSIQFTIEEFKEIPSELSAWWQSFQAAYQESLSKDWSSMTSSEYNQEILKFLKTAGTRGPKP